MFPLYVFASDGTRVANLNKSIVVRIESLIGRTTIPEDIVDYIYAVLHSANYRLKYADLIKKSFPRIPYPKGESEFEALRGYGKQLRELHLLNSVGLPLVTKYRVDGNNRVDNVHRVEDRVYINNSQYFEGVSEDVWLFSIGGYQIAQKWLKERVDRILSYDDIQQYQRIIVALNETIKVMKQIDEVEVL